MVTSPNKPKNICVHQIYTLYHFTRHCISAVFITDAYSNIPNVSALSTHSSWIHLSNVHFLICDLCIIPHCNCWEGITSILCVYSQVSQLTFVPTLVARPSHSVCLTTGRSSPEIQPTLHPGPVLLSPTRANARGSRKVSHCWITTWIKCNRFDYTWLSPHSSLPKKLSLHWGTGLYRTKWALKIAKRIQNNE